MEGMVYALKIAEKEGVEALRRDIRKRGITQAPLKYSEKQIDEFVKYISKNVHANMLAIMCWSLNDVFGFGESRLKRLIADFEKKSWDFTDLDYLGQKYIKLEDVAVDLNKRYKLGLDIERIAMCEKMADDADTRRRMCEIDQVLEVLKGNGYGDAAAFLGRKIE
jgi:hypothetical protein